MKLLMSIATLAVLMAPAAYATKVDAELVVAKFSQDYRSISEDLRKQIDDGKKAKTISSEVLNTTIRDYKIQVKLETFGSGDSTDSRLVVILDNTHGGIILDVNNLLSPNVKVPSTTWVKYEGDKAIMTTKMYFAIDDLELITDRLSNLTVAINDGSLGNLHASRRQ